MAGKRRKKASSTTKKLGDLRNDVSQRLEKNAQDREKQRQQSEKKRQERDDLPIPEENFIFNEEGDVIGVKPTMGKGWACEYYYTTRQIKMLRIFGFIMVVVAAIIFTQIAAAFSFMGLLAFLIAFAVAINVFFRSEGLSLAGKMPMPEIPYLAGVLEYCADTAEEKALKGLSNNRKTREKIAKSRGVDVTGFKDEKLPLVVYPEKSKLINGEEIFSPGTILMHWMNNNGISESGLCELSNGQWGLDVVEGLLSNNSADWTSRKNQRIIAELWGQDVKQIEDGVNYYRGVEL